jgi:hypothetical protein
VIVLNRVEIGRINWPAVCPPQASGNFSLSKPCPLSSLCKHLTKGPHSFSSQATIARLLMVAPE